MLVELSVLRLPLPADQIVRQIAIGKSRRWPLHYQLGGGVSVRTRVFGHRRHCNGDMWRWIKVPQRGGTLSTDWRRYLHDGRVRMYIMSLFAPVMCLSPNCRVMTFTNIAYWVQGLRCRRVIFGSLFWSWGRSTSTMCQLFDPQPSCPSNSVMFWNGLVRPDRQQGGIFTTWQLHKKSSTCTREPISRSCTMM